MSAVAVLGEQALIQGYPMAGAVAVVAETPEQVRAQWARMPSNVRVVILTPAASAALAGEPVPPDAPMTVVMPR